MGDSGGEKGFGGVVSGSWGCEYGGSSDILRCFSRALGRSPTTWCSRGGIRWIGWVGGIHCTISNSINRAGQLSCFNRCLASNQLGSYFKTFVLYKCPVNELSLCVSFLHDLSPLFYVPCKFSGGCLSGIACVFPSIKTRVPPAASLPKPTHSRIPLKAFPTHSCQSSSHRPQAKRALENSQ